MAGHIGEQGRTEFLILSLSFLVGGGQTTDKLCSTFKDKYSGRVNRTGKQGTATCSGRVSVGSVVSVASEQLPVGWSEGEAEGNKVIAVVSAVRSKASLELVGRRYGKNWPGHVWICSENRVSVCSEGFNRTCERRAGVTGKATASGGVGITLLKWGRLWAGGTSVRRVWAPCWPCSVGDTC